jgi:hypothetical protein
MISEIIKKYTVENWTFLEVEKDIFKKRYNWVRLLPFEIEKKYPWAVSRDIRNLFYLCVSYNSLEDFNNENQKWTKAKQLTEIHTQLIHSFCYSNEKSDQNLDQLIDESNTNSLLYLTFNMLERSLLWCNPEHTWPGDFNYILRKIKPIIERFSEETDLTSTNELTLKGAYFASTEEYTHVFYKFQVVCEQIQNGYLYSELKIIAKQAHEALIKAIQFGFEYFISFVDEHTYQRKIDEIIAKETRWATAQLKSFQALERKEINVKP